MYTVRLSPMRSGEVREVSFIFRPVEKDPGVQGKNIDDIYVFINNENMKKLLFPNST